MDRLWLEDLPWWAEPRELDDEVDVVEEGIICWVRVCLVCLGAVVVGQEALGVLGWWVGRWWSGGVLQRVARVCYLLIRGSL